MSSKRSECVKVVVRCRPMVDSEKNKGYNRVVDMEVSRGMTILHNPRHSQKDTPREFTFDCVYDWNSKQVDLYDETFRPIVDAVLEGYNGTIFAYGQTGTGKTYTMEGIRSSPEERGVIPNSFEHIFSYISGSENQQYLVRASYLEIYQEEIRDLLSKDQKRHLELKESPDTGVYVKDLSSFIAKSVKEIEYVMSIGNQNRSVGCTDMNEHSSRSHAIFIVTVECSETGIDGEDHIRVGKLNLVDLAGSERQSKTHSTGERFKEATKINLSLSALGNVISALVDSKSTHIPYRDSKLTRLLQDSLGGNAKTVMVANIGPASYNYDETLTTLRYANRAKNIKNKPRINEDPKDALLREYQDEITRLKQALQKRRKKNNKRVKRINEQGEEISEDEDEDEDEDKTNDDHLQTQQQKLEEEKKNILENTGILEEEREKLIKEVQHKVDELNKEQKKRDNLASKIKAMQSKLLSGGIDISLDQRQQRAIDLQAQRQNMIEMKKREREIQQQLELHEEDNIEVQGNYQSLHDEASIREKKLKKLQKKLEIAQTEISDYLDERTRRREDLTREFEELEKQMKLRILIIDNFIPQTEVEKIRDRAEYNEETDCWKLRPINNTSLKDLSQPVSVNGIHRPISMYARLAAYNGDVRYMSENILKFDLDMPSRTTYDYEGPLVTPTVQAVLDKAVEDDEEITINSSVFDGKLKTNKIHKIRSKDVTSSLMIGDVPLKPSEQFPEKRGLVSSKYKKFT